MGAGGVGSIKVKDDKISSLLISLSKLTKLSSIFTSEQNGKLSNILLSLIKNDKILLPQVNELKKLYSEDSKKDIDNVHALLKYILETIHKELSLSNEDLNHVYSSTDKVYDILIEGIESIIQRYFFGIKKNHLTCSNCKKQTNNYQILVLNEKIILSKDKIETDISDLIKPFTEMDDIKILCEGCKKNVKHITKYEIIDLPEIFIVAFENLNNTIVNILKSIEIRNQSYNLVGFINNKDENNRETENSNSFYLEKGQWFIYRINDNKKIEIRNIKDITGNPSVVFYQRDKTIFNNFYKVLPSLFKDKENILELANEHIVPGIKYEKYYLLNKDWYDKLLKIYENNSNYNDRNYIVDSMKNVSNIKKLSFDEEKEKYLGFIKRQKEIEDENLFKAEFKDHPKNFVIIKENILNDLLRTINLSNEKFEIFQKYLFEVLIGENNLFIKDNTKKETIYACYLNENNFYVYAILKYYKNDYFLREIKKYISNRGGLEYYYHVRKLELSGEEQDIIDKENEKVGKLENIGEMDTIMNMYKYKYNSQRETNINIKNTMVEFSNINSGNNLSNQLDSSNPQYQNVLDILKTHDTKTYNSSGYNSGVN